MTIANTAPVVDSAVIDQSAPATNATLSVTVTAHDDQNDPLTYAYQWTKNGSDIGGATSSTLNLGTAGNGDRGRPDPGSGHGERRLARLVAGHLVAGDGAEHGADGDGVAGQPHAGHERDAQRDGDEERPGAATP